MANYIFGNLTKKQDKELKSLIKKGWKFREDYWEDHHTDNPYSDVEFKSPSMENFASISEHDWKDVSEKYLLEREAYHVASDWARNVFHYTSVVTNPLSRELAKHFIKKKSTDFLKLYASSAEFDVKISDKIKENKPKKVKVTIEIL